MCIRARRILREFLDLWLPVGCAGCGVDGPSPCPVCLDRLVPADPLGVPTGLDTLAALLRYDDASRPFVSALKYRGMRSVATDFSRPLADLVAEVRPGLAPPVLTWAPTTDRRRRGRGFDQAEEIARAVGGASRSPVRRMLRRSAGPHQTGRTRAERVVGIEFDAVARASEVVVVCDDVLTTGSTLSAAATALRNAGAREVHGLVLARTPTA